MAPDTDPPSSRPPLNIEPVRIRGPADRKALRRKELTEAAFVVFARDGFAQASIDAVAKEANAAKGTVYVYFKSKEELFEAVVHERLTPVIETLESVGLDFEGPAASILERQVRFAYEKIVSGDLRLILRMIVADGPRFPEICKFYHENVLRRATAAIQRTIRYGVERGEFRDVPSDLLPQVLMGPSLLSAIWKMLFDDLHPIDLDDFYASHVDLVLNGLLRRPDDAPAAAP